MSTTLNLISAIALIIAVVIFRRLIERHLDEIAEVNPEKYKKKKRVINVAKIFLITSVSAFFAEQLRLSWIAGDRNYFNLAITIIFIISTIIVCFRKLKKE